MSALQEYSYATFLNVLFPPLRLVDVPSLVAACDNDDEFFFVLDGRFIIDLEDRSVELAQQQGFVVPKGVVHRTRAPERAIILMVETAAIIPTGDA